VSRDLRVQHGGHVIVSGVTWVNVMACDVSPEKVKPLLVKFLQPCDGNPLILPVFVQDRQCIGDRSHIHVFYLYLSVLYDHLDTQHIL